LCVSGALRGSSRVKKSGKSGNKRTHSALPSDLGRSRPSASSANGVAGQTPPNERKYVLRNQNKHRRTLKAVTLTAALACVLATGVEITASHAHSAAYNMRNAGTDIGSGLSGIASVYHDPITANGEHMNASAMTAAHKSLPFGSMVTVHN